MTQCLFVSQSRDQERAGQMADSAGQKSSSAADADEYQSSYLNWSHIVVISDESRAGVARPTCAYL